MKTLPFLSMLFHMPRDTVTISRKEHVRLLRVEARLKKLEAEKREGFRSDEEDIRSIRPSFAKKIEQSLKEVRAGKVKAIRSSRDLI